MYYKFIVVPLTFIAGLYALAAFIDLTNVDANLVSYKSIYGLTLTETEWRYQSLANYKLWLALSSIISVAYAYLSIWNLYTKRRWLNILVMSSTVVLYIFIIRNLYLWHLSGYDHP